MSPNGNGEAESDPMTTLKAHRSVLSRVQILKNRYGFSSGEALVCAALDAFEKSNGGSGNGGVHS